MSKGTTSYRIQNEEGLYYLTFATVEWIDIFTRKNYKDIIVESLEYCQKEKGLELFGWVLMSNHVHLIVTAKDGYKLSGIIRDFKNFTAQQIIKVVKDEPESRKSWLLAEMLKAGRANSKKQIYQLWRNDNHHRSLPSASGRTSYDSFVAILGLAQKLYGKRYSPN